MRKTWCITTALRVSPTTLQSNKDKIFTNDLLFETASGIWQAKTNFYQDIYDLSSPSYVLDQEAVTMHGKLLITDDPKFKK